MGGRTLECMALIGIGLDRFSITPAAVGPIKAMIRSLDGAKVRSALDSLLEKPPADMRSALQEWAETNGVLIG
jgi:phosphotransferase system enzyme I (PtsP)